MITFLRTWANQMIVALMIATIFEMILPNGKNQKYIKMVLGLYVLLTIIQPVMAKVTGNHLEISEFDYKKYFSNDALETFSQDFEENNSKLIEQAYIDNIKNDLQLKIKQKGYSVVRCDITILKDETSDLYGSIEKIELVLNREQEAEEKEKDNQIIAIEEVEVDRSNPTVQADEKENLTQKEKVELIEYLANEYSIHQDKIFIH